MIQVWTRKALCAAVILSCFAFGCTTAYAVANPPLCPHFIDSVGGGSWCGGAPWVKVIYAEHISTVYGIDSNIKVFYRPFNAGAGDQGCLPGDVSGSQWADSVWAKISGLGRKPEAVSYRNEFNYRNPPYDCQLYTAQQFPSYYDRLRQLGYTGKIVFSSFSVGNVEGTEWDDPPLVAATNKADAIETHEYFDFTVACCQPYLCFRHRDLSINSRPQLANKEWFIGEFGSDQVCGCNTTCHDACCRRGWKNQNQNGPTCDNPKIATDQAYITQMQLYREGCHPNVTAVFVYGCNGQNWGDFEVLGTTVADYMKTTWTPTQTGTITGNVKNTSAQNLSGATVAAGVYSATTDANGNYTLANVPVNVYTVTANKSGYYQGTQYDKQVSNGQTTTVNFTLTPLPTGTLKGNVKNGSAQNISGATVVTDPMGYSATTDANGNYTISGVKAEPTTYSVTASKSGYMPNTQTGKTVNQNQTTVVNFTLTLPPFGGLTNGNFDTGVFNNDPDADHKVGDGWKRFYVSGGSKSGGDYSNFRSSHWSQAFWEANWEAGIYQQAGGTTVGNKYTASAWVSGTDTNLKFWIGIDPTGGTSWSSQSVEWSSESAPGGTWTQISKQVTASNVIITVFLRAQNVAGTNKNAFMDDVSATDNGADTVGTIAGNVKDTSAQNISGVTVTTDPGNYSATTNSSGNYTISNVPTSATYSVKASKSGYIDSYQNSVSVTANQTTTVNFTLSAIQYGTLKGNVKNTSSQNLSGATVTTSPKNYSATTDSSGNYTISNVEAPQTYSVTASKSGYQSKTETGKAVSANQTTTVNFTLATGAPFSGVTNGNFEGGFFNDPDGDHESPNSWHRFYISGTSKSNKNYNVYHSSHWGHSIYESNWVAGIYQQATNSTGGETYTATVWVYGSTSDVRFWVGIDPTGGTNAQSTNIVWSSQSTPGTTWTQISKSAAAANGTLTMFIKAQNPTGSNKIAYTDDASLTGP